ncbi:MAG: hypothetical protein K5929_10650 [Lachnospiraceae bacterium]|nr:hypothetical protein [Lachnospiraceae bacterium]
MHGISLRWVVLILSVLLIIFLIYIYIKKPSTDSRAKRIRALVLLVPVAFMLISAFLLFGEHGGMGLVRELIDSPTLDSANLPEAPSVDEGEGVSIKVSGKSITINGVVAADVQALDEYLSNYPGTERVKLVDDFAVSSVMHQVMDVLEGHNILWDLDDET